MPEQPSMFTLPTYSVSEISSNIKRSLEDIFSDIKVKGEISGLKIPDSGHVYFNLKDESAVLNAVCWKGNFNNISFKPEDGMEVVVTGTITSFPGRSTYQINVREFQIAGVGELLKKLEERKNKFKALGLFDESRKRKLPLIPKSIGIITSPTGAVIKDIMHRIADRFPLNVKIWPVPVQGFESTDKIVKAIRGFNNLPDTIEKPEVIILARGGGSLEDLWCFNEEAIVEAIAESKIPIVSAIGHETDYTLCDYVADLRAPTPTAAAELCTPVKSELQRFLDIKAQRITITIRNLIEQKYQKLLFINQTLKSFYFLLTKTIQEISILQNRIKTALKFNIIGHKNRLIFHSQKISPNKLKNLFEAKNKQITKTLKSINFNYKNLISHKVEYFENCIKLIQSYNYKSVLARGFTLIQDNKKILKTKAETLKHNNVSILFADGELSINLKKYTSTQKNIVQLDMFEDK